jgi:microcystin-dependent protein
MENYLGEIRIFSFNTIPRGWISCSGQLLSIPQNQALFSLLGTFYGGDGIRTFGLPNLNGRTIIGANNTYPVGAAAGTESVTLITSQLPPHNHMMNASNSYDLGSPSTNYLGNPNVKGTSPVSNKANANLYAPSGGAMTPFAPSITPTGNSLPHENRQPFLVMSYCIATVGIYPSRS